MIVIKYGGHAGDRDTFVKDVVRLYEAGERPVIVHGGGPQISAMLKRLDIHSEFKNGLRVTTPEVLEVARLVLLGIGKELAGLFGRAGISAVGLSGEDGRLIRVTTSPLDIGLVGDVQSVDPTLLHDLIGVGHIPIIATIAPDAAGIPHNINADTGAAAVAVALQARQLMMLTDVAGVYRDWPHLDSLIETITASEVEALLPTLSSGMIPKMQACLQAVRGGVPVASVGSSVSSQGTKVTP